MNLATVRKAIAAGAGVVLTGVLEWATSATDLAPWLEQLVPAPLVPLVPIVLGGVVVVGGVWKAENAASEPAATVTESPAPLEAAAPVTPEPAAPVASPPAAPAATGAAGPFWAGVPAGEPSAATSLVQLLPAPSRSYQ